MREYVNTVTGATVVTPCEIKGGDWVEKKPVKTKGKTDNGEKQGEKQSGEA